MKKSESSVIPFLVPHRKVWLTHVCSNAANIGERKTWTRKVNFASDRIPPQYQPRRRPNIVQSLVDLR